MYNEAITDVTKYLANPINAYLIVKRLTADWREVENVMSENLGTGNLVQKCSFLSYKPKMRFSMISQPTYRILLCNVKYCTFQLMKI